MGRCCQLPKADYYGLCEDLQIFYNIYHNHMETIFLEWPENTEQNMFFPVPSTHLSQNKMFSCSDNEWLDNDYGDARRRLCAWVAEWLEDHMEELI